MNPIVHNLDEDKREPEYVEFKRLGKKIDISFTPSGISIPMMNKYDEYFKMLKDSKVLKEDGSVSDDAEKVLTKDTKKAVENLNKMVEIISFFTEYKDPEMTKEWIGQNLTMLQVANFMSLLIKSVTRGIVNEKTDNNVDKKKENGNV